jgi:hypothetical protein
MARTISELEFQVMEAHDFMWGIAGGVDNHTAELSPDPQGLPLAMHRGTPSDSTTFAEWHEACGERCNQTTYPAQNTTLSVRRSSCEALSRRPGTKRRARVSLARGSAHNPFVLSALNAALDSPRFERRTSCFAPRTT